MKVVNPIGRESMYDVVADSTGCKCEGAALYAYAQTGGSGNKCYCSNNVTTNHMVNIG